MNLSSMARRHFPRTLNVSSGLIESSGDQPHEESDRIFSLALADGGTVQWRMADGG
jgi:hypothetical protein